MNILSDIYKQNLIENEKNIRFWEEYIQNLNSLDFNVYSEKLKVPILVPIGNRILFRGDIRHTNEVTVSLGADYFVKCSIKQAEVLRQHRIKDAKSKLDVYNKEKEYLESQILFGKENLFDNARQDILETCSEEEDKIWRKKHQENLKKYNQSKDRNQEVGNDRITDEELWLRLEELELQEELENELDNSVKQEKDDNHEVDDNSYDSFIIKEDDVSNIQIEEEHHQEAYVTRNIPKQTSKIDLLQQVINRQKMLETKLTEMKNRQRVQTKTENDLLAKLDEIEQLDELEDEMDRLDDVLEGSSADEDEQTSSATKVNKSITFSDDDKSETLEINFKHSDIESSKAIYDPSKGITKPSDVYEAYENNFSNKTKSILKKTKYEDDLNVVNNNFIFTEMPIENKSEKKTICIKDVKEVTDQNQQKVDSDPRPTSLFKKKRQQQKLDWSIIFYCNLFVLLHK